MRTLALVCLALALTATPALAGRKAAKAPVASAASQESYWSGGVDGDDTAFYRDYYACLKENPGYYRGHKYLTPENIKADKAAEAQALHARTQMVNLCLRARGYVLHRPDGTIIP